MRYRPWKPSLDTLEAWRSFLVSMGTLGIAAVLLWLLA